MGGFVLALVRVSSGVCHGSGSYPFSALLGDCMVECSESYKGTLYYFRWIGIGRVLERSEVLWVKSFDKGIPHVL